jgi:hypothetical protein
MTAITLIHSTGSPRADTVVRGIVTLFECLYPQRITGYYVKGSYADQTAIDTSDLDLTIVFAAPLATATEQVRVQQLVLVCQQLSPLELDLTLTDEPQLRHHADPMFKLGAQVLYGQDIRATILLIPITTWARRRMHAAYWLMIHVFQRPHPVCAPLTFPQPDAPFYGYTVRTIRLPDGTTIPTTRNLLRVTGWIATARIAYQVQQYVVRKRECVRRYRQTINDAWTPLLEQLEQRCRTAWRYRIPDTQADQAELRAILAQTLAFENHFLGLYRQFLLTELTSNHLPAQRVALRMLDQTFYADPTIRDVLAHLETDDPELQTTAHKLARHSSTVGEEDS